MLLGITSHDIRKASSECISPPSPAHDRVMAARDDLPPVVDPPAPAGPAGQVPGQVPGEVPDHIPAGGNEGNGQNLPGEV
jgi:hypothetical protein